MAKRTSRRLWLQVAVRGETDMRLIRDTLIASIQRGDYTYPSNWYVEIRWRNRDDRNSKVGEFTEEMFASRVSSVGWDKAMLTYLRGLRV